MTKYADSVVQDDTRLARVIGKVRQLDVDKIHNVLLGAVAPSAAFSRVRSVSPISRGKRTGALPEHRVLSLKLRIRTCRFEALRGWLRCRPKVKFQLDYVLGGVV
jgi:hypothetical protein